MLSISPISIVERFADSKGRSGYEESKDSRPVLREEEEEEDAGAAAAA
jgi:hypothetical protein